MKQISTSLTSKLRTDSITERDYIIFSGETTKHYLWFKLYDDCYKDGNFIGTFIMKRVEFTYNDSNLEFKNKEFDAYKEYKLDNGTWESIHYGTFIVQSVEESDTKEEIKVTAYDYALKFANPFVTELNYSSGTITLFQVLEEVCQKVGVTLENTSIDNGSFIVDSNQFIEGTLFGNVITAIAQISCNFAKITPENKLKLLFKNESNITIETKDYEEFEDKRDTHPYNAVSLGMSDVEGENVTMVDPSVEPGKENYLTINDNPFAYTEEKRGQLIQAIFDKINGFGYSSFVLKNCLFPQLECGDLIKIRNKEGQLVYSIVLRPTYEETEIKLEAPSIINATVEYQNPVSAYDVAQQTQIVVNKELQTINFTITNLQRITSENSNDINNQEDTINNVVGQIQNLETTIEGITNTLTKVGGGNLIKDSLGALNDGDWTNQVSTIRDTYTLENSIAGQGIMLNSGTIEQQIQLPNEVHTLSFKYKKNLSTANVKLYLNDVEYVLDQTETTEFVQQVTISNNTLNIKFTSDTDNSCYILDLLLNLGFTKDTWTQNANETVTNTVKIGQGIQVENSNINTYWRADADGSRVFNKTTDEVVQEATDKGTVTNELTSRSTSIINGVLFAKVGSHRWISGV